MARYICGQYSHPLSPEPIGPIMDSEKWLGGTHCIECNRDTQHTGQPPYLFVNRIPASKDFELPDGSFEVRNGWMCWECQQVECDGCKKLTLDYLIDNSMGRIFCSDCSNHPDQFGLMYCDVCSMLAPKKDAEDVSNDPVCKDCVRIGTEDGRIFEDPNSGFFFWRD